ncbi:unannotated protein [freshwater metagenome]|uniref:Unannotated protein n=1 Tax=freshwater metagenome TaxID=449393 RepID=A0A6J6Q6F3_9ZZZZ
MSCGPETPSKLMSVPALINSTHAANSVHVSPSRDTFMISPAKALPSVFAASAARATSMTESNASAAYEKSVSSALPAATQNSFIPVLNSSESATNGIVPFIPSSSPPAAAGVSSAASSLEPQAAATRLRPTTRAAMKRLFVFFMYFLPLGVGWRDATLG